MLETLTSSYPGPVSFKSKNLAPVVQTLDSAIERLNNWGLKVMVTLHNFVVRPQVTQAL